MIIGAGTIVLPGVNLAEGTSIGASSLVTKSTSPWGIYYGIPAKFKKSISQDLLKLVSEYNMKYKADLGSSDL